MDIMVFQIIISNKTLNAWMSSIPLITKSYDRLENLAFERFGGFELGKFPAFGRDFLKGYSISMP